MDLPYWIYFSPVSSVLILCMLDPVSCSCIELLPCFLLGIDYFKCDYPDHIKPIHIVHTVFCISCLLHYSESLILQPPLSKSLSCMNYIFCYEQFFLTAHKSTLSSWLFFVGSVNADFWVTQIRGVLNLHAHTVSTTLQHFGAYFQAQTI